MKIVPVRMAARPSQSWWKCHSNSVERRIGRAVTTCRRWQRDRKV